MSEGCGFEPQHHTLDGNFSHPFLQKIVIFFENTKINEERGQGWPIKTVNGRMAAIVQWIH